MTDDLVTRLRNAANPPMQMGIGAGSSQTLKIEYGMTYGALYREAASTIAAQSARIDALTGALHSERIHNAAAVLRLRTWGDPMRASESERLDEETRLLAIRIKDGPPANPANVPDGEGS